MGDIPAGVQPNPLQIPTLANPKPEVAGLVPNAIAESLHEVARGTDQFLYHANRLAEAQRTIEQEAKAADIYSQASGKMDDATNALLADPTIDPLKLHEMANKQYDKVYDDAMTQAGAVGLHAEKFVGQHLGEKRVLRSHAMMTEGHKRFSEVQQGDVNDFVDSLAAETVRDPASAAINESLAVNRIKGGIRSGLYSAETGQKMLKDARERIGAAPFKRLALDDPAYYIQAYERGDLKDQPVDQAKDNLNLAYVTLGHKNAANNAQNAESDRKVDEASLKVYNDLTAKVTDPNPKTRVATKIAMAEAIAQRDVLGKRFDDFVRIANAADEKAEKGDVVTNDYVYRKLRVKAENGALTPDDVANYSGSLSTKHFSELVQQAGTGQQMVKSDARTVEHEAIQTTLKHMRGRLAPGGAINFDRLSETMRNDAERELYNQIDFFRQQFKRPLTYSELSTMADKIIAPKIEAQKTRALQDGKEILASLPYKTPGEVMANTSVTDPNQGYYLMRLREVAEMMAIAGVKEQEAATKKAEAEKNRGFSFFPKPTGKKDELKPANPLSK